MEGSSLIVRWEGADYAVDLQRFADLHETFLRRFANVRQAAAER